MTDREACEALRALIERSGLSVNQWAQQVGQVKPRTVRRWLQGVWPIPKRLHDELGADHESR